ncbi:MAG: aminoglycoside phosphotransferase family protein [Chloroflexi bacterium]|nr:aminoglycoside phosphotransferase family protein [Chloroflexota bacterium]
MKIDTCLVRGLVSSQFPQWAGLPIKPVAPGGHDNRTFRLGQAMSVRLPSRETYAAHVAVEHEWLPKLGPHLPLPIPVLLGKGRPSLEFPWPWSILSWILGETASKDRIADMVEFARRLASFLNCLQSIDATGAPVPGKHNFFRGGDLAVYDAETRESMDELRDVIDRNAAAAAWEAALAERFGRRPVWVHGDVADGNLLVKDGRLCGVIDFGQLVAGDPSCDVTIAWTLFSGKSREAFRAELAVDEGTRVRGRGWGLWKALLQLRRHRSNDPRAAAKAERVICDILGERSP